MDLHERSDKASVGSAKARSAVPTKAFRESLMSRYRRLKIEGGVFFITLVLADHGGALLIRHIERLRHTFPASLHATEFITIDPR
jgi:hypothetical protein